MTTELNPNPPRGAFVWVALILGLAGVVFFGILPERHTNFDWRIPSLIVGVPFWFSFDQQLLGLRRPLFRMNSRRVWIGRAVLAGGFVFILLKLRTVDDFVGGCLVLISIYLVVWATAGPESLFTATGWTLIRTPRQLGPNIAAMLSGRPLQGVTVHGWIRQLFELCIEIDRWPDAYALRCAVLDRLQSRECLAQYGERLDPEVRRAASEFVRSLDTRHVRAVAREFVEAYRRCGRRVVVRS